MKGNKTCTVDTHRISVFTAQTTICEMQSHTFTCTGNKVMHITNVLWGRLPPSPASLCNPFNSNVTGANCQGGRTATLYAEKLCNGNPSCTVTNDWQQLGADPCKGVPKYLQVSYACIIPTTTSKTTTPMTLSTTVIQVCGIDSNEIGKQQLCQLSKKIIIAKKICIT